MRRGWPLALCGCALALMLLAGAREARAAKRLEDCPIYQAITKQRRRGDGNRSATRYRNTRRTNLTTAGHITNGVKNVVLAPLDIPLTMRRVAAAKGLLAGHIGGPSEGHGNGIDRIVGGTTEAIAAPIPGVRAPTYRRRLGGSTSGSDSLAYDIVDNIIRSR